MGVEFKVSGADTGGDFAVVQYPIAPGRLVLAADARTPAPARLLEMIAPAGFETYFVELAEAGDPGRRRELAAIRGDLSIELACRADSRLQPEVYSVTENALSLYQTAVTPLRGWDRPLGCRRYRRIRAGSVAPHVRASIPDE